MSNIIHLDFPDLNPVEHRIGSSVHGLLSAFDFMSETLDVMDDNEINDYLVALDQAMSSHVMRIKQRTNRRKNNVLGF